MLYIALSKPIIKHLEVYYKYYKQQVAKAHLIYGFPFLIPFQFDNVNSCLSILREHSVGGLETITTSDICSGRLKAVLSLFFALSRFKQASKLKAPSKHQSNPQLHHPQIHQQPSQLSLNVSQSDMNR